MQEHFSPRPARAGFSMIELLAVMVILSILMVYLAFNLTGLGESAKRSGTLTFLRQAGGYVPTEAVGTTRDDSNLVFEAFAGHK